MSLEYILTSIVVIVLLTFLIFVVYGATASLVHNYVIPRPKVMAWLKRGFAATFGILGAKLVFIEN